MDIQTFINNYYEAFSLKAELPIAFWYSDSLLGELKQTQGCLFKALPAIRQGKIISMNGDSVGCGGGKFYTGFTPMPEHVPNFVSLKERYKQTPEMVVEGIKGMNVQRSSLPYLHFARIDRLTSFEKVEFFDNNNLDAVSTPFGSGCSSTITLTVNENRQGGHRTFLGFFDPSVRPYVESNLLSLTIPMSRFKTMYQTMRNSSLYETHAWAKIKTRINEG